MAEAAARVILAVLSAYGICGAVVATWFVMRGVGRMDPAARNGSWGFRGIIWPGCVALWPWILRRTLKVSVPRDLDEPWPRLLRRGHRLVWCVLPMLLLAVLALALRANLHAETTARSIESAEEPE